jgi:MFS transporter, DHA1 family, multidrug resistance protein
MKTLKETHHTISTILAFALIPLSGFATDIYVPSFPAMANAFGTTQGDIQLTLVVFIVSSGIGQLFAGSIVDCFGRYRIGLGALLVFAVASLIIALSQSVALVIAMRVIQGLTVALIVVSKRALIMDIYTGEKLKHYTSLFSIVWAIAPIIAPFIGGFLQHYLGWSSNFYFLAIVTFVLIVLELIYGGETLKQATSFQFRSLADAYKSKLTVPDFMLTLLILGLTYSMVMVFNMTSPFLIETVFNESPVVTGNIALLSGLAIFAGGILSKFTMQVRMVSKMVFAGPLMLLLPVVMMIAMNYEPSLAMMAVIMFVMHVVSGFIFNTFYAYAFTRFSNHAGIVSGLTGGGLYIITSLVSYIVVGVTAPRTPVMLGVAYLFVSIMVVLSLYVFTHLRRAEASVSAAVLK